MVAIQFPLKLIEQNHDWNIIGNAAVSGQTSMASVDVRSDGGGFWTASLNNIRFIDETYTLLWRALRQKCNGGVNPIIVPRRDLVFAPFPTSLQSYDPIYHSDSSSFDDGSGYYQPVIDVECDGIAALRATSMALRLLNCDSLQGGEAFSIQHPIMDWRLYEISNISIIDSTHILVRFNPPLREAVADGTKIEFDRPRCTMKLINSAAMDFNVTTYPFSLVSVKFIESKYAS